jgi:hypothetical protein
VYTYYKDYKNDQETVNIKEKLDRIENKIDCIISDSESVSPCLGGDNLIGRQILVEPDNQRKIERAQLILAAKSVYYTISALIFAMAVFAYSTNHPYLTIIVLILTIIPIREYCQTKKGIEKIFND